MARTADAVAGGRRDNAALATDQSASVRLAGGASGGGPRALTAADVLALAAADGGLESGEEEGLERATRSVI